MTRIDFHSNVPNKVAYACRLVRKAYGAKNRIVVLADDAEQLNELDRLMWTFSDTDFLPHVRAGDPLAAHTPIILTDDDSAAVPHNDVLVNLSRRRPAQVDSYTRVFEVISSAADDAAAGRVRYAAYKEQDYPLTHSVAGKT